MHKYNLSIPMSSSIYKEIDWFKSLPNKMTISRRVSDGVIQNVLMNVCIRRVYHFNVPPIHD